ncbi:MAG: dihydrolipoyllysine-residue acetyltransferase [Zoogloeaceae bacterium]|nr:dihydrolipoyllysine-residue acetyltransferase [Zoogloeaceae bacterium]
MSQLVEVKVPDIGDFSDVPVIELFVKVGDNIKEEDAICTLESDKATMDVPSSASGVVTEVLVALGDTVSEGSVLIKVESGAAAAAAAPAPAAPAAEAPAPAAPVAGGGVVDVTVPDIGDFSDVPIIDFFVKVGDTIKQEDAICTLESDKATMDVPSSASGTVTEVVAKVGDSVSMGSLLIRVQSGAGAAAPAPAAPAPAPAASAPAPAAKPAAASAPPAAAAAAPSAVKLGGTVHASPSVRAFARELGVDLAQVKASGPKNRILKEDVKAFVKGALAGGGAKAAAAGASLGGGLDLLPWPKVDFSKFGEIESKPLSRIKKISGQNLSRNWVMIPAVTYHEDADITSLEEFRKQLNKENERSGKKLTMLAFLMKACVKALQEYPDVNTSLDGDNLIYKKYYNIAFAADTPHGLVVPVVKDCDKKGVFEIAAETAELAKKARDGKLGPKDMSGACFTISSLGGIGGTYFAPIVNAPEVAILGVNKSEIKPVWNGKEFAPRLILPLSLTADHRVIDGALATRFNVMIAQLLADFRRVML